MSGTTGQTLLGCCEGRTLPSLSALLKISTTLQRLIRKDDRSEHSCTHAILHMGGWLTTIHAWPQCIP